MLMPFEFQLPSPNESGRVGKENLHTSEKGRTRFPSSFTWTPNEQLVNYTDRRRKITEI